MNVLRIAINYFKIHKLKALLIILLIIMVSLIALLPSQILRIIVDDGITNNKIDLLITYSIVYSLSYLAIGLITFLKDISMLSISLDITSNIRKEMAKHVHKMTYQELVNTDSGTLEAYFNNDVNSVNELFTSGIINMITDLFKMISILVTVFIYSYVFGLIVLVILPFLVLFTSFVRKKMMKANLKTKGLEGNVNKNLLENIENIEQIKINKVEEYFTKEYDNVLKNHFKVNQQSNFYDAVFSPIMQIIKNIVVVGILIISGWNNDIFGLSVGMIISGISLITDLFSPIETIGMEIQTIQRSLASVKRINQFFKFKIDDKNNIDNIDNYVIKYDDVNFSYEEKEVIKDFNLVINEGDKVVFKGPSGVGKSTLMKLAMGLIKPNKGNMTIGDINSYDLSDKAKRDLFSIVYQDPFFTGGSIYEEISLKDNTITKEDVRDILDKVGLSYIDNIDNKLISSNYSSGELALFNIARALVRKPKVIFLDEMNAKIDPLTAKNIIILLNNLAKDKTIISINHYGEILKDARIINLS